MPFNILRPNKKISQLIAQSWLDGCDLTFNKDFLVQEGIISSEEEPYFNEPDVDRNPNQNPDPGNPDGPKYIGNITFTAEGRLQMYIPYPARPDDNLVSNEDLKDWVNSDTNSTPWLPSNPYIPYTC